MQQVWRALLTWRENSAGQELHHIWVLHTAHEANFLPEVVQVLQTHACPQACHVRGTSKALLGPHAGLVLHHFCFDLYARPVSSSLCILACRCTLRQFHIEGF